MHRLREELDKDLVVVWHGDRGDVREAFEGDVAEHGDVEELEDQSVDQLRLEDVAQRDPIEEPAMISLQHIKSTKN